MYDGWLNFVGPAILSSIVVLAAWTIPGLARPKLLESQRHGKGTLMKADRYDIERQPDALANSPLDPAK